jgi:succinate dehydrogenase / fumarate reductase cytochrome b subunit
MLVSILHRATGTALAIGGGLIFTWWLTAAAISPVAYAGFYRWVVAADAASTSYGAPHVVNLLAMLVGIGLTWSFFQHASSGVRHFIMDTGAGFELRTNKRAAMATMIVSVIATILFWLVVMGKY